MHGKNGRRKTDLEGEEDALVGVVELGVHPGVAVEGDGGAGVAAGDELDLPDEDLLVVLVLHQHGAHRTERRRQLELRLVVALAKRLVRERRHPRLLQARLCTAPPHHTHDAQTPSDISFLRVLIYKLSLV